MQTQRTSAEAGPDKVLRIEIPVAKANRRYEVEFSVKEAIGVDDDRWPEGFWEEVMGSITDPTFRRHDQGEFPKRESFE